MSVMPRFITFEGGEGAGKTTQIKRVSEALDAQGIDHVVTREPGGCENALEIRKLLVTGEPDRWDGLSELLLYNAARNEHLRRVIRPALREGKWVLCDRYADSTIVYQSLARGIPLDVAEYVTMLVVQGTWPDMTLLLDIDPTVGIERTKGPRLGYEEDRFEKESMDFHMKLRQGFLDLANEHERFRIVDANQPQDDVQKDILRHFEELMLQGSAA